MNTAKTNDFEEAVTTLIKASLLRQQTPQDLTGNYLLPSSDIIERWFTDVMALGYNKDIDAAIDDIYEVQSKLISLIGPITRNDISQRVKATAKRFAAEVAAFRSMANAISTGHATAAHLAQIEKSLCLPG